jgi:phage-related protein
MAIPWPSTLPQVPQKGFTESVGINVIRSQTDTGPAKQRRRASRANEMNLSFIMTTAQTQRLEDFIKNDINGVARFQFTHPRLYTTVDVRIVPGGSGEFFTLQYLAPGYWSTSLKFEVMP